MDSAGRLTPVRQLFEISDYVVPFVLRALMRLGVLDVLMAAPPQPTARLAERLCVHERSLLRVFLLLESRGLLTQVDTKVFAVPDDGSLRRLAAASDHEQIRHALLGNVAPWAAFASVLQAGEDSTCMPTIEAITRAYEAKVCSCRDLVCPVLQLDWVTPVVLRAVSASGAFDQLGATPADARWLAGRIGLDAPVLHCALRLLTARGVVGEEAPGHFTKVAVSALLTSRRAGGLREAHPLIPAVIEAWGSLHSALTAGDPAFDLAHGTSLWSYLGVDRNAEHAFSRAMGAVSRYEVRALRSVFPWPQIRSLVDVGGGDATTIATILLSAPSLRAVSIDLPYLRASATSTLEKCQVVGRGLAIDGDFFRAVPGGADAYLMKRVLYGWSDEGATQILSVVRDAMRRDSALLIAEPMFGVAGIDEAVLRSIDLLMLSVDGGRVRTVDEVQELLHAVGLAVVRVAPTPLFPVLEASRA